MNIRKYVIPNTIEEAYETLNKGKANIILGGGCFNGISSRRKNIGIDISELNLNYVKETEDKVFIGADNTLRDIETNDIIKNLCNGILVEGIKNIGVGIQLKNTAKFGASIYAKYGFSDLIPILLVLDAELKFYNIGIISIKDYLEIKRPRDILMEVIINKTYENGIYISRRIIEMDIPQLNMAIITGDNYKIAVGARPQKAIRCDFLHKYFKNDEKISAEDLSKIKMGSNIKASELLRQRLLEDIIIEGKSRIEV